MNRKIIILLFFLISLISLVILSIFFIFVFYKGLNIFSLEIIFDNVPILDAVLLKQRVFDGIFNAIIGSLFVSLLAIIFALPLGFLSGVFIAIFASKKIKEVFSFSYELLAFVPSIVIGLFGLSVTIYLHKIFFEDLYTCLLISSICLAILIIPYIVKMTEQALYSIPYKIKNSALNLGATKYQNLFLLQLPYISKQLFSSIVLAIGRAVEDTAVIMMTGAVAMAAIPSSVFQKYEAIPFFIFYISSQYQDIYELNKGYVAAMILLFVSLSLFIFAFVIQKLALKRSGKFE
ncbi:PstA family ABC transporter permease [Aliarcobacter lanthieri]|uniref:PstA family ABC transporter permease n=1 Tax=Aliarcobacter lanthieri TaxID=1355374 RepID=UPI00047E8506|nr:ABC transporter permease subunit [Aliarcobacter lanthieri]QKF59729.1 phosphate ABC transporter, permease protein [Aliarcobacter lanthieri]